MSTLATAAQQSSVRYEKTIALWYAGVCITCLFVFDHPIPNHMAIFL